jgi:cobaltochelatase CobN
MYMGGLATAVRNLDGKTPEMVVANTRDPSRPEMTSIDEFLGTELRSRYLNPTWIEGMQREGYAGAGEMRAFVEYLWGWDATASETVDDAMWQEAFEVYVADKHDLAMSEFFERSSPFAFQDLTARMLETVRKGYWQAEEAVTRELLEEYLESIERHGVGCSEHTCGNPRFLDYVAEQATVRGIPVPLVEGFRTAVEQALGTGLAEATADAEDFVRRNEERVARRQQLAAAGRAPKEVAGLVMETIERAGQRRAEGGSSQVARGLGAALFGVLLLGVLFVWRHRYQAGSK